MTPHFTYRGQPIAPADRWPGEGKAHSHVRLHHPLAHDLIVQSWAGARLQLERLNALSDAGYRLRRESSTDSAFWRLAQQLLASSSERILDHPRYFRHDGQPVVICHTYANESDVREHLPRLCERITAGWDCDVTCTVDQRFNFYYPESGIGYEFCRPSHTRPRRFDPSKNRIPPMELAR